MVQKKPTEKFYVSPSTGQPCSAAQYIAEIVCVRKAEKEDNNLGYKFWNKAQKDQYKSQITVASKLIRLYGEKAVLSYLNNNKNIYSLGYFNPFPFVKEGVAKEKNRLDSIPEVTESGIIPTEIVVTAPKRLTKNNMFLKIGNIEKNGKD